MNNNTLYITGAKTESVVVSASPLYVVSSIKIFLYNHYRIPLGAYIKDGKLVYNEQYGGHHTWTETFEVDTTDRPFLIDLVKGIDLIYHHTKQIEHSKD